MSSVRLSPFPFPSLRLIDTQTSLRISCTTKLPLHLVYPQAQFLIGNQPPSSITTFSIVVRLAPPFELVPENSRRLFQSLLDTVPSLQANSMTEPEELDEDLFADLSVFPLLTSCWSSVIVFDADNKL